jgi:rubrerythrin
MAVSQQRLPPPAHTAQLRVELRCLGCGYGAVVARRPGRCPMCGIESWAVQVRRGPAGAKL